jgi:hypothetical protein
MKARSVVGAVLTALLIAAAMYLYGGSQTPAGQPPLRNVTAENVADIRNEFNAANGDVRVLLLMSPT